MPPRRTVNTWTICGPLDNCQTIKLTFPARPMPVNTAMAQQIEATEPGELHSLPGSRSQVAWAIGFIASARMVKAYLDVDRAVICNVQRSGPAQIVPMIIEFRREIGRYRPQEMRYIRRQMAAHSVLGGPNAKSWSGIMDRARLIRF